jgi:hypothetical protein
MLQIEGFLYEFCRFGWVWKGLAYSINVACCFSAFGEMCFLNSCPPEPFWVDVPKDLCDGSVYVGEAVIGKYINGYSQIKRQAVAYVHTLYLQNYCICWKFGYISVSSFQSTVCLLQENYIWIDRSSELDGQGLCCHLEPWRNVAMIWLGLLQMEPFLWVLTRFILLC